MLTAYRAFTRIIHAVSYPVTRMRAARNQRIWRDRLGLDLDRADADLWLHAASVGEVKILSHLWEYLRRRQPDLTLCVSVLTEQGYATAREIFGEDVKVRYLPADTAPVVRRVLEAVHPRCLAIAETEIWPNLITEASERNIPVVLVNGRMSDVGFGRYRLVAPFLRTLLRRYDRFFFKSETDAERYRYFGVPADKYQVVGDMKFDAPLWPRDERRITEVRRSLGVPPGDFLVVAGSTRPGEEALLLETLRALREDDNRIRLVMAPRHVERLEEVRQICRDAGIAHAVYGDTSGVPVVIIDRMGLLMDLYMAADLAFVGGTMVDIGGHNILEPVWAGTPVIYGPSLANVADAAEYIEANHYGARIADREQLLETIRAVRAGKLCFARKTDHELSRSAVAATGDYLLSKLRHA